MASGNFGRQRNPRVPDLEKEIKKMNDQLSSLKAQIHRAIDQHQFVAAIDLIQTAIVVKGDIDDTVKELEEKKKSLDEYRQH